MKFPALILLLGAAALPVFADTMTCQSASGLDHYSLMPVSCSTLEAGSNGIYLFNNLPSVTRTGNNFNFQVDIQFGSLGGEMISYHQTLSETFDDVYRLLPARPSDVFRISTQYTNKGQNFPGGGNGSSQFGPANLTGYPYTVYNNDNGVDCRYGACDYTGIISAAGLTTFHFTGSASFDVSPGDGQGYGYLTESFNAQLLKADGTPDTFTPEPASIVLTLAGFVVLGLSVLCKETTVEVCRAAIQR